MIKGRSCLFFVGVCRTECCIWRVLRSSVSIFKELVVRCLYFVFVLGTYLPVLFPFPSHIFGD